MALNASDAPSGKARVRRLSGPFAFFPAAILALAASVPDRAEVSPDATTRVLGDTIALGDSIFGSVLNGEVDTFYLSAALDDTIDIALWPEGGPDSAANTSVRLVDPLGVEIWDEVSYRTDDSTRWGFARAIAGRVITEPGTYLVLVGYPTYFDQDGTYMLTARRSGAIVSWSRTRWADAVEGGAPVSDTTVWVFDMGARPTTWSLTSSASWLSASPSSGTTVPPAPPALVARLGEGRTGAAGDVVWDDLSEAEAVDAPESSGSDSRPALSHIPGSAGIYVTRDPAGFSRGDTVTAQLSFEAADGWFPITPVDQSMRVTDPRFTIIAEDVSDDLWAIEMHPNGQLVISTTDDSVGSSLEFMDPVTGNRTPWFPNISPGNITGISGLTFGPDSVLWITDNYNTIGEPLSRIFPGGGRAVIEYTGAARESTVAPDGTLYFGAVQRIFRVSRLGAVTQVWEDLTGPRATGIAYHPLDGKLYFAGRGASGRVLRRLDPETGFVEELGDPGRSVYSIHVGASGYLYLSGLGLGASLTVMTTEGEVVEEFYGPRAGGKAGSILVCGAIYGTTGGLDAVYRFPIDDCPMDPAVTNLIANHISTVEVAPGWQRTRFLTVTTNGGTAAALSVDWSSTWLSVEPTSGTTPTTFEVGFDATELAPGMYRDTLVFTSPDVVNSPFLRPVALVVVESALSVGDSLVGTFVEGDDRQRVHYLDLVEGDVVDIGVFDVPETPAWPLLSVEKPDGGLDAPVGLGRSSPNGAVIAAYRAPQTGTYGIRVTWRGWPGPDSGSYVLKSRVAGAVAVSDPHRFNRWAPAGPATVTDTLWLFNSGPGSVAWELVGTPPSWLTLSATSGTLSPAPASGLTTAPAQTPELAPGLVPLNLGGPEAITARPPPAGATRVVLTANVAELAEGETVGAGLTFRTPVDTWAGDHEAYFDVTGVDPSISILTPLPYRVMDVLVYSDDELVVTRNRDLWKVNRHTGAATAWVEDLGVDCGLYPTPVLGIEHAGDGALYVADQCAVAIYRVEPDGSSSTVMQLPSTTYDPIVLPDGTLIASTSRGFYRLNRDGSVSTVAEVGGTKRAVYNPFDGWIYFASPFGDDYFGRVNPATGRVEVLEEELPFFFLDLQLGASGNLYANSIGGIYVLGPSLEVLDHVAVPSGSGFGIALGGPGEDIVYATSSGWGGNGHVYSYPVADHRAPLPTAPASVARIDDQVVFPGTTVTLPIVLDISGTGKALGSFAATVSWDPAEADFVSLGQGDFDGLFEFNTEAAGSGRVLFAGVNANQELNVGEVVLAELVLSLTAPPGTDVLIDLGIQEIAATDFSDLSGDLSVRDGLVYVTVSLWGDPSNDNEISALDALMCLTVVVRGELPEGSVPAQCDVAPDVDADADGTREGFDGTVTALDALAILRHVVELSLPDEIRVGRPRLGS